MDWLLLIFKFWNTLASIFGCSINIFLIYLCLFKSPKTIKVYVTLVINFAITDIVACFFHILLEIRVIPIPMRPIVAFQLNGLCQYINLSSCQIGLGVFLHCISHGLWSLLLSFCYRLYILTHSGLKRTTLIKTIGIIYIPSFLGLISIPPNLLDSRSTVILVQQSLPFHNLTGLVVTSLNVFRSPSAFLAVAHIVFPIYPVYFIIFLLRRKIVEKLLINAKMLSKETKAVHSQMLKCLTYQACIPVFMLIAVSFYFVAQFGIINNIVIELATISVYMMMPVLSSLTYICFVRPYREYCKRLFSNKIGTIALSTVSRFNSSLTNMNSSKPSVSTIQC